MKYAMAYPFFPPKEIEWILNEFRYILEEQGMLSMHQHVFNFEKQFSEYIGSKFAVATNSCTAALEISLRAIGLQPGDEVIVPVETFIATGAAVVRENGRPVFADVSPDTFCLSLDTLQKKVSSRTRAVIIVHMAGMISPDMIRIKRFCDENNIILIEDAAHALGASIDGLKAGNIGHLGCFSFFPTKIITTAEGGMLVTSDSDLFEKANSCRNRGQDMNAAYEQYTMIGTNNRMTEFAAIMGQSQLRCLETFLSKRRAIALIYNNIISSSPAGEYAYWIHVPANIQHANWRYMILLNPLINRDELKTRMAKDSISLDWAYYPPLHLQPVFKKMYGNQKGMLPASETLLDHHVCLPMHPGLEVEDADYIANKIVYHIMELTNANDKSRSVDNNDTPVTKYSALHQTHI